MSLDPDHHSHEAIIARCTPAGSGALALLRLSGAGSTAVAQRFAKLSSGDQLGHVPTHTIHHGWITDEQGVHIDEVMFLVMRAPRTFTGEDTVEITCHNNPLIVDAVLARALACGARLAREGEFAQRAFLNGKIDLAQAEAINELIHANTQFALKKSLAQREGSLSAWVTQIEKNLTKALALSEASFEFIDEENMTFGNQIAHIVDQTTKQIETAHKTFDQQQHIKNGVRIALIGSVNVGKSSLFNTLLSKDRAIVTSIAGTTRDAVEAGITKNGMPWTLIDTAGLRSTDDIVEQEGIKRSFEQAALADVILLVYDGSQELSPHEQEIYQDLLAEHGNKIILVRNKIDQPSASNSLDIQAPIEVSAQTHTHIATLEKRIAQQVKKLFDVADAPFLLTQRQFNLLRTLEHKLVKIKSMLHGQVEYELVSHELKEAIADLAQLTGKSISEAGMDAVFKEFCVGK